MTPGKQQQYRRAVRTAIYAITVLCALGFLWWIIDLMRADAPTLRIIAVGLLGIVGISTLGYTGENLAQRLKFRVGVDGMEAEIGE